RCNVMDDITIDARRQELLEARFLGNSKVHSGSESGSSFGAGPSSDRENDSLGGYPSTPENQERGDVRKSRKRKGESMDHNNKKVGTNSANIKKINEYFEPTTSPARTLASPSHIRSSPSSRHSTNLMDLSGFVHLQQKHNIAKESRYRHIQTELHGSEVEQMIQMNNGQESEKNKKREELIRLNSDLEYRLRETTQLALQYKTQLARCLQVNQELLVEKTKSEKSSARRRAMEGRLRLGQFTRQGTGYQETWVNGWAFTELGSKKERINKEKEDIERARKSLSKRKPSNNSAKNKPSQNDGEFVKPKDVKEVMSMQDYHERDEVLRQRLSAVKRDEVELQVELEKLERERSLHIRELKRISNEDNSRFNDNPVLNKQYLFLTLLGKGGFSEVYKGFDLEAQRYVAVKIHHLNREWHELKKLDYARHANREAEIHRRVNHPRIVSLYDRFEVDINTFCTVMEFCGGNDLDFYLKQHRLMGEKEARTIIMQVVSALVYLNSLERPVIHYDLKPGNILLCNGTVCGDIKITDFGLSKQFDEGLSPMDGMDLTSQGSGTFWYLPPECFVRGPGGKPPKIDNKVDVWSVGVIFYQCLYGKKPFGHNLTQEAILKQNTILRATEVTFPNKPTVSAEAKSFIRCCLGYHKEDRADVLELSNHAYLKPSNKRSNPTTSQPS
uniref:Serine/threonine-protein kinase tousled-like 1-B n=1 Tax=Ciona intestinalis TaxID=7719 RepID=F7A0P7_CIOIN